MELEELRAQKAEELYNECVQIKKDINRGYLKLGKLLCTAQEEKLYKPLGYKSIADYGCSNRLSVPIATSYKLIDTHKKFQRGFEIDIDRLVLIGKEKLIRLLPVVNLLNHEEWLNKAENMSPSELYDTVEEYKKSKR